MQLIRENRGKHFDPGLVDLFLDDVASFVEIKTTIWTESKPARRTVKFDDITWVINSIPDAVLLISREQMVVAANPKAAEMFDTTVESWKENRWTTWFRPVET